MAETTTGAAESHFFDGLPYPGLATRRAGPSETFACSGPTIICFLQESYNGANFSLQLLSRRCGHIILWLRLLNKVSSDRGWYTSSLVDIATLLTCAAGASRAIIAVQLLLGRRRRETNNS